MPLHWMLKNNIQSVLHTGQAGLPLQNRQPPHVLTKYDSVVLSPWVVLLYRRTPPEILAC